MPLRYKLTNSEGLTMKNTAWEGAGIHKTSGKGPLCDSGWLHCYNDPYVAVFLNPTHADFINPRMCEVECSGEQLIDHGTKEGWTEMQFIRWVDYPTVTLTQRIAFGILCAKEVYNNDLWNEWADNWLSYKNRTASAAASAAASAYYAAARAADAVVAAAQVADAVVYYTDAASAYYAAAAAIVAAAHGDIDFPLIARKALQY